MTNPSDDLTVVGVDEMETSQAKNGHNGIWYLARFRAGRRAVRSVRPSGRPLKRDVLFLVERRLDLASITVVRCRLMAGHDNRRVAPATTRNRDAILEVLRSTLPATGLVLEIASGTGEHVEYFARQLPHLEWQPSDPSPDARRSIAAWTGDGALANVLAPLDIDAAAQSWPIDRADGIVCINMMHISSWAATVGLMRGATRILDDGAPLFLYGPFRRTGRVLEPSNEIFDQDLRARDPRWGLRELDDVIRTAAGEGLRLNHVTEMPAYNLAVVFRMGRPAAG